MTHDTKQLTCECGKNFSNQNELEKHQETCATAQASRKGQKVHGAGGSHGTNR